MRKSRVNLLRVGILLAFVLSLATLLGGWACSAGSAYHNANRAAKQIADDAHELEAKAEQLDASGQISDAEAINLAQLSQNLAKSDDQFIANLKTLSTIDASNSAQVTGWVQGVADSVNALGQQGIGGLKSQSAKDELGLVYQGITGGLTTLQGLLAGLHPAPAPAAPGHGGMGLWLSAFGLIGLALADQEVLLGLSIFNSAASLITKWVADGRLADTDLQTAALAENADTENHAADFIARLKAKQAGEASGS